MEKLLIFCRTAIFIAATSAGLYAPVSAQYRNNAPSQQYSPYTMNNPNINPYANPTISPQANPSINPYANPNINPYANPNITPCGLYGCSN